MAEDGVKKAYAFLDEAQYLSGWEEETLKLAKANPEITFIIGM